MAKHKITKQSEIELSEQEERFCELMVYGGLSFAGQPVKCFIEVFGIDYKNVFMMSRRMMAKPHIASQIKMLADSLETETENIAVKLQIAETLKSVMQETATANFEDRWGIALSPAPLRAVSVNAAKALMELYPVKHEHTSRLRIEGGDGQVIFNVVVPQSPVKNEEEED